MDQDLENAVKKIIEIDRFATWFLEEASEHEQDVILWAVPIAILSKCKRTWKKTWKGLLSVGLLLGATPLSQILPAWGYITYIMVIAITIASMIIRDDDTKGGIVSNTPHRRHEYKH